MKLDYILTHQINNYKTDGTAKYDYVGRIKFSEEMKKKSSESTKKMWENEDYRRRNIETRLGKKHTQETIELMKQKGKLRYPFWLIGTISVVKDNVEKKIKLEELEEYLSNGWIKGRKKYKKNGTN